MLPENATIQPLPSITTMFDDSVNGNQVDGYCVYDQYNDSPFLSYSYAAQPMYFNTLPESSQHQFDPYAFYNIPCSYDQSLTTHTAAYVAQPAEPTEKSIDTTKEESEQENGAYSEKEVSLEVISGGKRIAHRSSKRISKPARDVICSHCSTGTTTLWRKNEEGNLECNACNLYYRHNKVKRPLSLCKEKPSTRKRRQPKKAEFLENM